MRNDVITVDAPSSEWLAVLDDLRTPTTRVHPQDFFVGSGASLASDLADDEHNAWTERVFAAVCAAVAGDVELLDEDDNVVLARHQTAA